MATEEKKWPTNQKKYRDQAAEQINLAYFELEKLADGKTHSDVEIHTISTKTQKELLAALRWLERAGAPTQPRLL